LRVFLLVPSGESSQEEKANESEDDGDDAKDSSQQNASVHAIMRRNTHIK
jgi:hypothetical protein